MILKKNIIIVLLITVILLSGFIAIEIFKTRDLEKDLTPQIVSPARNEAEINTIFAEFLNTTFQSPFITEAKIPHRGQLLGMEACGEQGCPEYSIRKNPDFYGLYWTKDNNIFYGGIHFKPNSQEIEQYQSSVIWNEVLTFDEEIALDLINSYFKINSPALECQIKIEEGINYKKCRAIWQDFQENENGIIVVSAKGEGDREYLGEGTFIFFCSVPPTGILYNKQNCI